jgi:hypothetical protein
MQSAQNGVERHQRRHIFTDTWLTVLPSSLAAAVVVLLGSRVLTFISPSWDTPGDGNGPSQAAQSFQFWSSTILVTVNVSRRAATAARICISPMPSSSPSKIPLSVSCKFPSLLNAKLCQICLGDSDAFDPSTHTIQLARWISIDVTVDVGVEDAQPSCSASARVCPPSSWHFPHFCCTAWIKCTP